MALNLAYQFYKDEYGDFIAICPDGVEEVYVDNRLDYSDGNYEIDHLCLCLEEENDLIFLVKYILTFQTSIDTDQKFFSFIGKLPERIYKAITPPTHSFSNYYMVWMVGDLVRYIYHWRGQLIEPEMDTADILLGIPEFTGCLLIVSLDKSITSKLVFFVDRNHNR